MKLIEVKLTNFRGYAAETSIGLDDLTVIVGRNDAGKSSILDALEIFFNESDIERADCCTRTESSEIRIACVFDDLPTAIIIDDQYSTTLGAEYLLRQDGKLEIVKTYDCTAAKGKNTGIFARALHPGAEGANDLLSLKISELKTKARGLGVDLTPINQTIKADIRSAIRNHFADLQLLESDVDLKKESGKQAYDQIQLYMPIYALFKSDRASTDQDAEAQDPLKSAIKEAIRLREAELNTVIDDIKHQLEEVAAKTVEKIREMDPDLANELSPVVKNKNWDSLFTVSLTGDENIPINKRGSGTRRLVLLNFFRAKAEEASQKNAGGVIYAVEEPETSQHPNNQIMLLEAFEQLVEQGNCQVFLTTHTPTLARRVNQNCLRLITKVGGQRVVEYGAQPDTPEKIVETLGILPDHDVKAFVGIEGKYDISFLKTISRILSQSETDIPDLDLAERDGKLVFVPLGGSSLELWVNRLRGFGRPEFYLTDRDNQPPQQPKYHQQITAWTARGCTAWVTTPKELENYLHHTVVANNVPGYRGTLAPFEDVPYMVAEAVHTAAAGPNPWTAVSEEKKKQKISAAKKRLNTVCVGQMTPQLLTQSDPANDIRTWLRAIGAVIR